MANSTMTDVQGPIAIEPREGHQLILEVRANQNLTTSEEKLTIHSSCSTTWPIPSPISRSWPCQETTFSLVRAYNLPLLSGLRAS